MKKISIERELEVESGEFSTDDCDIDSVLDGSMDGELQQVPEDGESSIAFENIVYTERSDSGDYLAQLRIGGDGSVFVSLDVSAYHDSNICEGYYIGSTDKVTVTGSLSDYDIGIDAREMARYVREGVFEPFESIVSQVRMDVVK